MARFRLSRLAEGDVVQVLTTSEQRWGKDGRRRYAAIVAASMRRVAAELIGPATRDRGELSPGIRSFHIRHARGDDPEAKVRRPVHVLYYRVVERDLIEIVRVLHERMEPSRHVGTEVSDA
jgi:toxin ParE1/3/4